METEKTTTDTWYRVKEQLYATCGCDDVCHHKPALRLDVLEFRVVKATPEGVWLTSVYNCKTSDLSKTDKFWVGTKNKKKYACPTLWEAYRSFVARKKRQIQLLEGKLSMAKEALDLVESKGK